MRIEQGGQEIGADNGRKNIISPHRGAFLAIQQFRYKLFKNPLFCYSVRNGRGGASNLF